VLRVEAVLSGGIVPVSKRWTFEECAENLSDAHEIRRLLDDSGFWSHPTGDTHCHPDQQRLFLRVRDTGRERGIFLPIAGCGESMRALGAFVAARVTWSPTIA
jgi:hypothetical protein